MTDSSQYTQLTIKNDKWRTDIELPIGTSIFIKQKDGKKLFGRIKSISETSVDLGHTIVRFEDIAKVGLLKKKKTLFWMMIISIVGFILVAIFVPWLMIAFAPTLLLFSFMYTGYSSRKTKIKDGTTLVPE